MAGTRSSLMVWFWKGWRGVQLRHYHHFHSNYHHHHHYIQDYTKSEALTERSKTSKNKERPGRCSCIVRKASVESQRGDSSVANQTTTCTPRCQVAPISDAEVQQPLQKAHGQAATGVIDMEGSQARRFQRLCNMALL